MSKKYYAWKNRDCQGINPDWVELTGKEFVEICKANKSLPAEEKRWFYKLPGLEEGDDYLIMECTYKNYLDSDRETKERIRNNKARSRYEFLSMDFEYTDDSGEEYTLHDIIGDERVDVENDIMPITLYKAIEQLSSENKSFILYWLEMKEKGISDNEIAFNLGITFSAFRCWFSRVCKELKKFF